MSKYTDIDTMLDKAHAFIAGGQSAEMVSAAEARLGIKFPPSFREYLLEWGNLSFDGCEYYGLTRNADFDNAGVPNCIWFTLRKRLTVDLPHNLIVFRNDNDEEYMCINTDDELEGDERRVVIWDNVEREIYEILDVCFIDFLREELSMFLNNT